MKVLELSVQCWNINGIFTNINGFKYSKLDNPLFDEIVQKHDIFGLIETHHTDDDIDRLQVMGYKCFQACRKKLKFGRKHGGLAVYVRNMLLPGVSLVATTGSETVQIKLDRFSFSLDRDLVISFSYCSPANSSYTQRTQVDSFDSLEEKLSCLGQDVDMLLLGDFNARTGRGRDYIRNEDNTHMPGVYDYQVDNTACYTRGNMDLVTNNFGERLLSLCKSVPLRICNGRKLGDILGNYTCYTWNGKSTVDYCMVTPRLYHQIQHFLVSDLYPTLSDHCPIVAKLRTKFVKKSLAAPDYKFQPKPGKIRWDTKVAQKFENLLQLPCSKIFIENFAKNGILDNQTDVDTANSFLTDFITNTAINAGIGENQITFECPPKGPNPNWKFKKKKNRKKVMTRWHDATCDMATRWQ